MSPRWHLPAGLEIVQCPALQPGLPVVWCPSIVAAAFARQLRAAGYRRPLPRALIERALAEWGARRWRPRDWPFVVPCDCGRFVRFLLLTPAWRWGCRTCLRVQLVGFVSDAARLLFALRIGFRGAYVTRLHLRLVRRLCGHHPRYVPDRLAAVMAATVVASYEPRIRPKNWSWARPGPLGLLVGEALADAWLDWVSPVAYAARCRAELGG